MSFESVGTVLQYLISKKGTQISPQEKIRLKEASDYLLQFSKENGLPFDVIKTLADSIIFENCFDVPTRRRLLYSCVPNSGYFPYEVIPLAVSCAALPDTSSTWQYSILTWLSGLIDFHVIDGSNKYIHICYTTLFNLLDSNKVCALACKILLHITRLEDVTPNRTKILLRLEKKAGMVTCISSLIRIYKYFRPDLIVSRLDRISRNQNPPKLLTESLKNAQLRLEETDSYPSDSHPIWAYDDKARRLNPFHDANAIPEPEILLYNEKIEEKKQKKISVLQFRSIKSMIRDLPHWKDWIWPNNSACLLSNPATIFLFKPHDPFVKICLTNWLEIALRTEIVDDCGSHARQESLLCACVKLLKVSETIIPAVFHFLMEFLMKWDFYSHFAKVTELLSYFPFISPTLFFDCVFVKFSQVLATATLPQFCSVIDTFGNMVSTWLLQARQEKSHYRKASDWPFDLKETSPLQGVYYLSHRLERSIMAAILRFGPHPMLLNTVISFYRKVNMYCKQLQLPLLVVPPAEFFLMAVASGDIVAIHRSGHLLASLKERIAFVKASKSSDHEESIGNFALSSIDHINFAIGIYLDTTVSSAACSDKWKDVLSSYVGEDFYNKLASTPNIRYFGCVCRALPYLPLSHEYFLEDKDLFANGNESRKGAIQQILLDLKSKQLDGVLVCAKTFTGTTKEKSQDES